MTNDYFLIVRQIIYELLPPDKFVGGYQWGNGKKSGDKLSSDIWLLHASWTSSHSEKITKFKMLGYWFYNNSCKWYKYTTNHIETPNHQKPKYYLWKKDRKWTFPDYNEKQWWK